MQLEAHQNTFYSTKLKVINVTLVFPEKLTDLVEDLFFKKIEKVGKIQGCDPTYM